ncbi:dihydroorotate dehydrogenase electron transfer subunit [Hathewaya limosa]|uniref:Dihydroorotate dehydrogenase B (NAD(+)), electron transfer subunit n=1 Tax=Hathewaya limosa TaxID=1536 RepID=A0ABU0JQF3_HATLI|nr:dihydroorotate dehydrogenase electron transfer subunit [Hathewaya limosa]MDQ0479294.1 dihydroorotate dehydrogenase electron transfer subunit [Hathewaya limosa]
MICSIEKVIKNKKIQEGIYEIHIEGNFQGIPGQFYMLKPLQGNILLPRPISIYDVKDNYISFLYQVVGEGTDLMKNLNKGDEIQIMGPLGNGFNIEDISGKVALVAGGIGIAPMVYLSQKLGKCEVDFYAGFRTVDYSVDNVEKNVNKVEIATEQGIKGHKGYVTDLLKPEKYDIVITCGPTVMMKKVVKMCMEQETKVLVSMENRMACGLGACLGCTCKTKEGNKTVCKTGPVFIGEDLIWND